MDGEQGRTCYCSLPMPTRALSLSSEESAGWMANKATQHGPARQLVGISDEQHTKLLGLARQALEVVQVVQQILRGHAGLDALKVQQEVFETRNIQAESHVRTLITAVHASLARPKRNTDGAVDR